MTIESGPQIFLERLIILQNAIEQQKKLFLSNLVRTKDGFQHKKNDGGLYQLMFTEREIDILRRDISDLIDDIQARKCGIEDFPFGLYLFTIPKYGLSIKYRIMTDDRMEHLLSEVKQYVSEFL